MDKPRVFLSLDALRGTAAIAVLQYHTDYFFGTLWFPHGYLAVDFFFMLSGFVLSFAYQEKIDADGFFWRFLKTRLVRLYPLYFIGFLIGFLLLMMQAHLIPGWASSRSIFLISACGILLFPVPPTIAFKNNNAFPLNTPSWSLFSEIVANILHVLFLRRRSTVFLLSVAALLMFSVLYLTHRYGTLGYGWSRNDIYIGMTRVMFSYMVGMLLYRLHKTGKVRVNLPPMVSCLVLLTLLAVRNSPLLEGPMDLLIVIVLFPLLLITSTASNPKPRFAGLFRLLGTASYAVYVVHQPVAAAFDHIWVRMRGVTTEHDAPWPGIIFALIAISLAIALDKVYDMPVRAWLGNRLLRRRYAWAPSSP